MARRDYVPTADSELVIWLDAFNAQLNDRLATFRLEAADVTPFETAAKSFDALLAQARAKLDEAKAATAAKRAARRLALQRLRPLVPRLQAHPLMTDEVRAVLGLSLRDAPVTTTMRNDPVPDVAPLVDLDFGVRGQITIHFGPNPAERNRNGLPDGALGAVVHVPGQSGPRTGAYRVAYLYRRGKRGPWSAPATASVTV